MQVTGLQPTKKGAEITFLDTGADQAASLLATFFSGEGFKLESGTPINGEYGQGSAGGRIAAGGFVKRRKYRILVSPLQQGVQVSLESTMSGWSGSVLGAMREQQGRKEFVAHLQTFLAPYQSGPTPAAPPLAPPPPPPPGSLPPPPP
jgi:hypothetical protein